MSFISKIFKKEKPVIGMVHLLPLIGTPYYNSKNTPSMIEEAAVREAEKLKKAGFDGFLFANEGDRPYLEGVGPEIVSLYSRIVTTISKEFDLPYGLGVLMDPFATLAMGKTLDASFVRMYLTGVFAGTFGLQTMSPGKVMHYRKSINAMDLPIFCNVTPHAGVSLDTRDLNEIVDSIIWMLEPEVILVPGPRAGLPPKISTVGMLKEKYPNQEIIISSGISIDNVKDILSVSDGVIIGTSLKKDNILWNEIDEDKAKRFIDIVKG